mmetsp:Transcript_47549/g.85862  ORF Transcript_47549/g.85862 Transcript_47549/m.85862 type:complete len:101 (-) Transcript_47549:749-1051(-)
MLFLCVFYAFSRCPIELTENSCSQKRRVNYTSLISYCGPSHDQVCEQATGELAFFAGIQQNNIGDTCTSGCTNVNRTRSSETFENVLDHPGDCILEVKET